MMGDYERAREHYALLVETWIDPDPELLPLVERSRQALIDVTPLQRD